MIFLCVILAFYLAFMLGANDVANSMGTSVGSGAISFKKAIAIAAVMEFLGAVLFGQQVSRTIATGIVDPSIFADDWQQLLIGMVAVLLACGIWLNFANWRKLPVASSHAIIGALVGFGWIARGAAAVKWQEIGLITLVWVFTPVVSASLSYGFIKLLHKWIDETNLNEWIPWLSAGTLAIVGFNLSEQLEILQFNYIKIALGAVAVGILSLWLWQASTASLNLVFSHLQVVSASFVAFAHGSNDVGNAIAPLALTVEIIEKGAVSQSADLSIPAWIFILGGTGIVAGLAILGRNVIATVGEGITKIEPRSGFAAELSTATMILIASHVGLPVSTTHTLVGAVVGIGLSKGDRHIDMQIVKQIALAWVVTIPAGIILGAVIYKAISMVF